MKKIVFAILSFTGITTVAAQTISVQEYINTYAPIAISEMKRVGIPASITIAQGILETESGNSDLVRRSNNHFGIKCKSNWTGASVFHDDDEAGECFRKYETAADSYRDHSDFLRNSSRYAFLFELDPSDYKGWAYGLKKAGYATNPRYPVILIKNIEDYNLQQYDEPGAEGRPVVKQIIENGNDVSIAKEPEVYAEMNTEKNTSSIKAGKTLFNGLKAVFVPKGTSLLAIATQFDISLVKLMEYNDLKTDGLLKDEQWIFLEKKQKEANRDFYIAERNETLYSISQTNAVQLETLLQYNNYSENEIIKKGTKIWLRHGKVKATEKNDPTGFKMHEVQPKEGLYAISKKYNITVAEIKELNSLTAEDLSVGQQLIISK